MNTLLTLTHHAHSGIFEKIMHDVFLHGLLDTLKTIPFLFFTYLLMEFIEHKAADKTKSFMERAGVLGPLVGGAFGAIPQCGFSAAVANFYTARVVTLGTLIAIFLSTSDEMLPILISGKISLSSIFIILAYKAGVGIFVGFSVDFALRIIKKERTHIDIDGVCEENGCQCENGIFRSALHHTLSIGLFLLIITFILNALVLFIGNERLSQFLYDKPIISHLIASVIGLIPNCAVSVLLTNFALSGFITAGTMLSGLFSGAGVGLLVLFKVNPRPKENLAVVAILICAGTLFGLLADVLNFSALL